MFLEKANGILDIAVAYSLIIMQIYYLFLKERNHIKGQEFNFGGEYIFHYDQIKQTLTTKLNPFFVPRFYSPAVAQAGFAEISNVTGIIAENGAGKTTLLNVIRENFAKGGGGVKDPLIITFEHNGLKKICHYGDIPISGGNYADYGFSVIDISPKRKNVPIVKKANRPWNIPLQSKSVILSMCNLFIFPVYLQITRMLKLEARLIYQQVIW